MVRYTLKSQLIDDKGTASQFAYGLENTKICLTFQNQKIVFKLEYIKGKTVLSTSSILFLIPKTF